MRRSVSHVLAGLGLMLTALMPVGGRAETAVTVFAAASLTDALQEVAKAYEAENGVALRLSFASSSTLARQIEAGAPADIFLSANPAWIDYLTERGMIEPDSRRDVLGNTLVLIEPGSKQVKPGAVTDNWDIAELLGPDGWLAIGDPDHVPAGIYAKQALRSIKQWSAVEKRLARSDNVRAALALVARGEAALGIVYGTDKNISDQVTVVGMFGTGAYDPITYPFVIIAGRAAPPVRSAFDFLTDEASISIFEEFGFTRRQRTVE